MFENGDINSLIKEAELIEANSQYAHIRHCNGTEATVPIRHRWKKYTVEETIPELTIAEHNITNNLHGSISDSFDSTAEFAKWKVTWFYTNPTKFLIKWIRP